MGENQGVIWVLIGALVLGVAIFAMGKYFSTQTESQGTSIAYQQNQGVDEGACETQEYDQSGTTVTGTYTYVANDNPDWTADDDTTWDINGTKATQKGSGPHDVVMSTGVCNFA